MDAKDRQGEDSKSTDRGKRKMDEEDEQKSQENPSQRPCPSTNQPMASQSPNTGCSQFYFRDIIEIPADKVAYVIGRNGATINRMHQSTGASIKIQSGPRTPSTYRKVHLDGTSREQIESARTEIYDMIRQSLHYGYINPPGMRPESQALGSYPAHSSYSGYSSSQPPLWCLVPSPSGRHAAPWPGSLSIHPSNLGNHPIQPASQYQANPSFMPPAPWPRCDLPSSSSGNYGYQANPSTTPSTSQPGACPAPSEYYAPHVVHQDPISPSFSYQTNETVMRPASQPGAYPIPLFDTTNNPPTHATTQSQATTLDMPSESSQEIYPAPALHHNDPIQSEAGDQAYSSAMHESTSRKRQRK